MGNEFAEKHGLMAYQGHTLGIQAVYLYEMQQLNESAKVMQRALSIIETTKTFVYTPWLYAVNAAIQADLRMKDASRESAQKALDQANKNCEYWAMPEILRLVARCEHIEHGDPQLTASRLLEAINTAKQQSAHLWNLRSATDLAELWQQTGNRSQAGELLETTMQHVPESGHTLPDWHTAQGLFRELS